MSDFIRIESIDVLPDRMVCDVHVADRPTAFVTPELAEEVCAAHPDIVRHACHNGVGPFFGDVLGKASLPHLLEHLIIDNQVALMLQRDRSADATFTGATQWSEADETVAQVTVSFKDDLIALEAVGNALDFLNDALRIVNDR